MTSRAIDISLNGRTETMILDSEVSESGTDLRRRWLCIAALMLATLSSFGICGPARAGDVQVFETTADGAMLVARQPDVAFGSPSQADATITVVPSRFLQPWAGVGGAMTDSAAVVLARMPSQNRAELMRDLFAPGVGAGFSLVRVPMGASDFSAVRNYNEEPTPGSFDFREDERVIIPQLREARSFAPVLRVFATPWSPPPWMKASVKTMNGGHFDPSHFGDLAAYFSAFIAEYEGHGVPIFAVSPQNEPLNSQSGYPTEYLSAADEATFIAGYLAPRLQADGRTHVRILGLEDNWADLSYVQALASSPAAPSIAGYSFHCYKGDPSQMSMAARSLTGEQGLWLTECTEITGGTFGSGFAYHMHQIVIGGIRNGARGLIEWNLALNPNGGPTNGGCMSCTGIVTVDDSVTPPKVAYGPVFYALSQVSHVVRPGANVVASSSSGADVEGAAFLNTDGRTVLVAFNDDASSHTLAVTDGRRSFGYTLPSKAAATFVWSE